MYLMTLLRKVRCSERTATRTRIQRKGGITPDSGATSHIIAESMAATVDDADLHPHCREIHTAKVGDLIIAKAQGRLGQLRGVLITDDHDR